MSWLVDRSALLRLGRAADPELWSERAATHQLQISGLTVLEFGVAARTADEWKRVVEGPPLAVLPRHPLTG